MLPPGLLSGWDRPGRQPILIATKYLVIRGEDIRMQTSLATKDNRRFENWVKSRPPSIASQEGKPGELWRQDWLLALLLVVVTMVAYLSAWNGTPIWDDDAQLTKPELRSLDGLARIWTQPGATQQYYPLVHSCFWLESQLWGNWPAGYHLLNILLHCTSALLLVRILRLLQIPGAWLAAAIFALHPIQVESVAWISELKNMLSGVFYFGSLLAYLKFHQSRNLRFYLAALILFGFGLLSKTVIATLPAALLVILWWKGGKLSWKEDILPLVPFFLLGTAAGLFTAWVERNLVGANGSDFNYSIIERSLIAGRAIWFYLDKLFWPLDLIFVYPRWQVSQTAWWQYLFPTAVLLLLAVLIGLSRRWRGPLAGFLFFIGTLFPALGFFNVYPFRYSLVADHFQYLAGLGMMVLVASGIDLELRRGQLRLHPTGSILCGTLLATLAILTWQQSAMYTNIGTLWRTTIERNPKAWMAHDNLGALLLREGQVDEAIVHFRKAVEIDANQAEPQANLGNALLQKGELDDAVAQYFKALALKPNSAEVHYNLGNALLRKGQTDGAIAEYEKALAILPDYADVHNNLGIVLFQKGDVDQAIAHYQRALEINPQDVQARANLAWTLATSPQTSLMKILAVKLAQQANERTGGANPTILRILAAAFAQAGRFSEAVATAERSLQLATVQNNVPLAEALRAEIGLYQNASPYRAR
jgi:protein O-mannosyl-transferase